MAARRVFMLGESGAGKSFLGCKLLENSKAFKKATTHATESETKEISQSKSVVDGVELTVFDTPGMGDTQGRSIEFLDHIVDAIQKERPHGFVFVVNGSSGAKLGPGLNAALACFAQCLKPAFDSASGLPLGRVLLVVNHLEADGDWDEDEESLSAEEKRKNLATAVDEANKLLSAALGASLKLPVGHTFGVQERDANLKSTLTAIRSAISALPDEPLDSEQFRTYTAVMQQAIALKNNAVSAEEYAEKKIVQLNYDIGWHEKRYNDCMIAMGSTCWIPFVGLATTAGFASAILDSENKIPILKGELAEVERNKEKILAIAKDRAVKWLRKITTLKESMGIKAAEFQF